MIELVLKNQKVKIDRGELVSYKVDGYEFIHQKGSPGWGNADTEMFPVIGPTADANFKVNTPKGVAVQDQHGLLREMVYSVKKQSKVDVVVEKEYKANTIVLNSKYPEKSKAKELYWPYDFVFEKAFVLKDDGLQITFTIKGEEGMPFMLGYHPAFKIDTNSAKVVTHEISKTIPEIMEVGSRAMHIPNCEMITLNDQNKMNIKTKGFGHFMLWTEVTNMLCIEPITFYPYEVEQMNLHRGFDVLTDRPKTFEVYLSPLKTEEHV